MTRIHSLLLAATALAGAGFAQTAAAEDAYLAGGASLPNAYYTQAMNCYGNTDQTLHVNNNTDQVIANYSGCPGTVNSGVSLGYVSTGSGRGIEGYIANDAARYLYTDKDSSAAGFQVRAADSSLLTLNSTMPLFSGSDAALTTAQLAALASAGATDNVQGTVDIRADGVADDPSNANDYKNFVANYGAVIQVPALYAAVAVAFDPTYRDENGVEQSLGRVTLSQSDVCGIFTGSITTLNGLAIQLVGRSDGSGTTELFTRFLASACGGVFSNPEGTQTLPNSGIYTTLANGNDGVAAALNYSTATPANTIRIGYLSNDYLSDAVNGLNHARPGSAWAGYGITAARIINANNGTAYDPNVAGITAASLAVGFTPPTGADAADPAKWAPLAANSAIENPTAGYPIIGTSNHLVYSCYSTEARRLAVAGTNASGATPGYLYWYYNTPSVVTPLLGQAGFVALPTALRNAITSTFFNSSSSLAIGSKEAGTCASGVTGTGA
ncbi:PstS family phosphate ABC transporter substrate-binding protein [Oleisolibacter albus]|uniref:PstS family phosphate ABC transporter substrate-binding protein n=1 Tax=Oleisolibacter albus TaxID=2171757 RepID=UPI000DF2C1D0|nr:substrate-binding domain-containing protein [Oleisolibacter albus]